MRNWHLIIVSSIIIALQLTTLYVVVLLGVAAADHRDPATSGRVVQTVTVER